MPQDNASVVVQSVQRREEGREEEQKGKKRLDMDGNREWQKMRQIIGNQSTVNK